MTRLLVIGALLVSLVVPVGAVAMVVVSSTSNSERRSSFRAASPAAETSSTAARPKTESFELFSGEKVQVDPACDASHNLSALKQDAIATARQLPALKQSALNSERDFKRFLRAHPEHDLAALAYATYKSLRTAYQARLRRYNQKIATFNRRADRFNSAVEVCRIG